MIKVSITFFRKSLPFLAILFFSFTLQAHEKVVVIPLLDDTLEPLALIPADIPSDSDYSVANGIVLDKVTGLEWQQINDSSDFTYSEATDYCGSLVIQSRRDWRIPNLKELFSITNLGVENPAINVAVFPGTTPDGYWSSTEFALDQNLFRGVRFRYGGASGLRAAAEAQKVRCVRSNGRNALLQLFVDNGDGTVSDLGSGLVWQQQDDGVIRTYSESLAYCEELELGGSSSWRLPEIKELVSTVDFRVEFPAIDTQVFNMDTFRRFWSVTPSASSLFPNHIWVLNFNGVGVSPFDKTSTDVTYARCVR